MILSGSDLLPFSEAKTAIGSDQPHVAGINIADWIVLTRLKTIEVDEVHGQCEWLGWDSVGIDGYFVPVRCLTAGAIFKLGLDSEEKGYLDVMLDRCKD